MHWGNQKRVINQKNCHLAQLHKLSHTYQKLKYKKIINWSSSLPGFLALKWTFFYYMVNNRTTGLFDNQIYFFQNQTQHYNRTPQLIHFDHFFCFGLFSVKPEGRPTVSGFKTRHRVGDTLQMTCFINNTFPEANLTWFVSGKIVSTCVNKTLRAKLVEKLVDFRPRLNSPALNGWIVC